jgi:hypothetical protein
MSTFSGPLRDETYKDGIMNSLKIWIHGLAAAAISAFASAASGALALPTVFTFDRAGFLNMVKLATVPALLAVFAYLKSSPVPALASTSGVTGRPASN